MKLSFWSDENRWFVPRAFGLGYSLNLKYLAKRLGWIRRDEEGPTDATSADEHPIAESQTREDRLRERIESSKREGG